MSIKKLLTSMLFCATEIQCLSCFSLQRSCCFWFWSWKFFWTRTNTTDLSHKIYCTFWDYLTVNLNILTEIYRKWITIYKNQMCSVMCSVIHYTAFIFADNAFHFRLIKAELMICIIHSFHCSDDWIII